MVINKISEELICFYITGHCYINNDIDIYLKSRKSCGFLQLIIDTSIETTMEHFFPMDFNWTARNFALSQSLKPQEYFVYFKVSK